MLFKTDQPRALLALEDGTVVSGRAIGAPGETGGELCFNTSMTGYQEILTDPSYHGQIMMMTYPHIGNYGTNADDDEADRPMVAGLVVRSYATQPSNFRSEASLDAYMKRHGLTGVTGVDTRRLVLHIRAQGVMNAVVSSIESDRDSMVEKARAWPRMEGLELASRVSTLEPFDYCEAEGPSVAVYDFGVKRNILRSFQGLGCRVRVFPSDTPLSEVLDWRPNGLFFSNGPGDPRAMPEAIATVSDAMKTGIPMFGICLGHQLMSLAQGFEVYKMFVGHRGGNQPVKNLDSGHVEVTTQNHGFAVRAESIYEDRARLTHHNLNDDTVEGIRYKQFTGFSVQYHPEASPGPHDSHYLFQQFLDDMNGVGEHSARRVTRAVTV